MDPACPSAKIWPGRRVLRWAMCRVPDFCFRADTGMVIVASVETKPKKQRSWRDYRGRRHWRTLSAGPCGRGVWHCSLPTMFRPLLVLVVVVTVRGRRKSHPRRLLRKLTASVSGHIARKWDLYLVGLVV